MNEFPLKRNDVDEGTTLYQEINNIFQTMSKSHRTSYSPNNITNQDLEHFMGLIIVENKTIKRLGKVSDYFQEQHRISAKRYDEEKSAIEYWEENKHLTRQQVSKNVRECTTFCGTIICTFIKMFKSKKILDFSSGWGDRLFATMTYDEKIKYYYGIDPNKKLHTGYKNMIKTFLPKSSRQKYNMICGCAENTISNLEEEFDLVFTSPPYYNLEEYSNDSSQSIKKYPKFEDWYNKFLFESMKQAFNKLVNHGIMAININNTKDYNIIDRLITDMNSLEDIKFNGIIYFGNPKCKNYIYQPILVWEKKLKTN